MAAPLLLQLEGITAMKNPFTACFNLSALMRDLPADGCLFVHGTSDTIRTIASKSGCHVFVTDPHLLRSQEGGRGLKAPTRGPGAATNTT
jgi:hypothetical protein